MSSTPTPFTIPEGLPPRVLESLNVFIWESRNAGHEPTDLCEACVETKHAIISGVMY